MRDGCHLSRYATHSITASPNQLGTQNRSAFIASTSTPLSLLNSHCHLRYLFTGLSLMALSPLTIHLISLTSHFQPVLSNFVAHLVGQPDRLTK